jgi:hypothetical protein
MHRSRAIALVVAFGAVAAAAACASGSVGRPVAEASPVLPARIPSAEREIYALVVAHVFQRGPSDTLLVVDESPAYHDLPAHNFLRRGKDIVPPPLPARLSALSAGGTPVLAKAFPPPARTLPAARARRLAAERLGGTGILAVTPIAFTDDSAQALVYYEVWCGSLCGGGYEVWLVRGPDGRWVQRQEMTHWVS